MGKSNHRPNLAICARSCCGGPFADTEHYNEWISEHSPSVPDRDARRYFEVWKRIEHAIDRVWDYFADGPGSVETPTLGHLHEALLLGQSERLEAERKRARDLKEIAQYLARHAAAAEAACDEVIARKGREHRYESIKEYEARRAAVLADRPRASLTGQRVLCAKCGKRDRVFDDLCKRCANEAGTRPKGKIV